MWVYFFLLAPLLTGANSSGKSSVISAILGMMQTQGFPFYFSPNGKYVDMGSFEDLSWNHEKGNEIKIGLNIKAFSVEGGVETVWIDNQWNTPILKEMIPYNNILPDINFRHFNYLSSHRQPTQRFRFQESKSEYDINKYGENYDLQILAWK